MARAVPYARTFPCSTLVIDGTTGGGELDSDPRLWRGAPYALFDVEDQHHVTPRLPALWIARLALRLAPAWAFALGALEFRRDFTLNLGAALMESYDSGRDWAHRITGRRLDNAA